MMYIFRNLAQFYNPESVNCKQRLWRSKCVSYKHRVANYSSEGEGDFRRGEFQAVICYFFTK